MTKYEATLSRSSWLALVPQSFDTDRQLLQQFAVDGTQDAFAVLVRRHAGMVFRVCRRTLLTVQDAEDACQATFLILARRAADRWQESVSNWLFTTARRVARDARRATERREQRERRTAVPEAVQLIDQLTARELLTAVDEELDRLPPLYREPLVLHYLEELARDEIAARLGVPTGTVKIRLERGRKRLHAALTKRGIKLGVGFLTLAITSPAGASPPRIIESILAAVSGRPPAAVAALARGVAVNGSVMKTMLGMAAIAAVAAVAMTLGVAVFAAHPDPASSPLPSQPTATITASDPQAPQAGMDAHGDPLPAGALLRIGTTRMNDGGAASHAALSPDGKVFATASEAGVIVFDLATGRRLLWIADSGVPNGYTQNSSVFTFAPDGKKLFILSAPGAPTIVSIGSITAYDLATGNKLVSFKPPPKAPGQNQQPDMGYISLWFPAGSRHLVAVRHGITVLLDPDTGKEIKTLAFESEMVQATPDGLRLFAIPEKGQTVVVHDGDGKVLRTLEHTAHPGILGFDPAGVTVAAATGPESKIRVWELATGKVLADVVVTEKNRDKNFPITALTISPDRKTVLAGTPKGGIYRFDIASGKELPLLRGHYNFVTGLFFTDGGKILVSSSWDQRVIRWDLATGKPLPDSGGYAGHLSLDRSPDGKLIAAADDSGLLELLNGVTGQRVRLLQTAGKPAIGRVAFGPNGSSLATAHKDAKIRIWESATGRLVREIEIVDALKGPMDQGIWFQGLAFAPDGRTLVTSGFGIGIYAFDTGTGKLLWNDPTGSGSLAFLPDGRSIVVGEWASQLRFRDAASGKKGVLIPSGHFLVDDVAASLDGKLLASGHHDGFVCLRDPVTGAIQKEWQAHKQNEVTWGVSFGPGGIWMASAGDKTVALWDVATGTLLHRFEGHISRAHSARFALDGRTLLSSSLDLTGYVWDVRPKLGSTDARTAAQLWDDLAAAEPQTAFRAVWLASADPKAPAVFGEKIPSPPKLDAKKFQKLAEELASSDFKTREAAEKEMLGFGPSALGLAKKASEGADSQEAKVRLDRLIHSWSGGAFTPENWRRRRAVVAMELAGTAASRELLKRWAADVPGTVLSDAAVATLARLEQLDKSNLR